MKWIPEGKFKEIEKSIPLPCVDVFVESIDNGYLFILRNIEPQKYKWAPIGGIIKRGETVKDTCKRVVKKEVGLDIEELKFIDYSEYHSNSRDCVGFNFTAKMKEGQEIKIDENEVLDYVISYKPPDNLHKQYKPIYKKIIGL